MGTNFFIKGHRTNDDNPRYHIGKRSAAGLYCWDCKITLHSGGNSQVHQGRRAEGKWLTACPICDKTRGEESLDSSTVGRELGFNKSKPQQKTGVASCSSFNWAMPPERLVSIAEIEDEYGHQLSQAEFIAMLEECPIRFCNMIGKEFS